MNTDGEAFAAAAGLGALVTRELIARDITARFY